MSDLASRYAAVVCDLDGVVYRGPDAVGHAVESLRALEVPVVYATNNASRPPVAVAEHLVSLGLECSVEDVVTSSDAGAWLLAKDTPAGTRVLAVGGPGVAIALRAAGLVPVEPREAVGGDPVGAVMQGYGPDVRATDLAEVAYAAASGARWVATNTDATLPTERGVAPGNGSLVAAVTRAAGRDPDLVAGKPHPPLYLLAAERLSVSADRVLAVGDRLDTDIQGAVTAGIDALLVLTGVDDLDAVLDAPRDRRPRFVAPDLRWLRRDPTDGRPSLADLSDAVAAVHRADDDGAADGSSALRDTARQMLDAMRAQ